METGKKKAAESGEHACDNSSRLESYGSWRFF